MMKNDALFVVFARNAFYRRMHFLALGALTLAIAVIAFLVAVLIYLINHPVHPLYFATDNVGKLIPIIPVTVPNMTTPEVTAWTIEAVQTTLSNDFINYRAQLQSSEKYFTPFGWTTYMNAIRTANNLPALLQRKLIVVAQLADQPKLVTEGILGGAYAWKFDMPMLLTFMMPPFDDMSKFTNAVTVSVIVQRQPVLQSYKGLGIVQLIVASAVNVSTEPQEISSKPSG